MKRETSTGAQSLIRILVQCFKNHETSLKEEKQLLDNIANFLNDILSDNLQYCSTAFLLFDSEVYLSYS